MRRLLLAVLPVACAAALTPALTASAGSPDFPASGRCSTTSTATCHFQYGRVTLVADGDTIRVNLRNSGGSFASTVPPVRFTGINAMEMDHTNYNDMSKWTGDCHSVAATKVVYNAIHNSAAPLLVRLAAQDLSSNSAGRLRRQ